MAYRIEYDNGTAKMTAVTHTTIRKSRATVLVIVLIILCCLSLYCVGRDRLYEALIPGDPAVTEAAAIKFVEEIQQGASITDAFGVFCKEIIHRAVY